MGIFDAGAYVGGHLGYGMDNSVVLDYGSGTVSSSFDMSGYMLGPQGGYNWAIGGVVVGVEADAAYTDVDGNGPCPTTSWSCAATLEQLITLRGRVGMPVNNFLLYGILGLASGQVEVKTVSPGGTEFPDSARQNGWIAGVGGEMSFSKNLNGRVELLYTDLGNNPYVVDFGSIVEVETKVIALRVGANWKF